MNNMMNDDNLNDNDETIDDDVDNNCKYCGEMCDAYERPALKCIGECSSKIHVKCLKRGGVPGSLLGDVFFELICVECSPINAELINRVRMSWLNVIILTLYNLREKSSGISKRGYFHWKSDISTFVDKNWDYLFQKGVKRRKNWIGTISGTLSHYSTSFIAFFKSGTNELNELGWWRLYSNDPPELLISQYNKMINQRKKLNINQLNTQEKLLLPPSLPPPPPPPPSQPLSSSSSSSSSSSFTLSQSQELQQHQQQKQTTSRSDESNYLFADDSNCDSVSGSHCDESSTNNTPSMFSREYVQPSEILSDFLMEDDEITPDIDIDDMNESFGIINDNDQSNSLSFIDIISNYDNKNNPSHFASSSSSVNSENSQYSQSLNSFNPQWMNNILNKTNIKNNNKINNQLNSDHNKYDDESSNDSSIIVHNNKNNKKKQQKKSLPSPLNSLFKINKQRNCPWIKECQYSLDKDNPQMSKYDEEYLLNSVDKKLLDTMTSNVRRYYRKLAVRKIKRDYNLPLLNIDNTENKSMDNNIIKNCNGNNRVIDRFYNENSSGIYEQRLQGYSEPIAVHSPYTNRLLKPFIRRDITCKPLWLNVMNELCAKANKNNNECPPIVSLAPIDYCYVRPHHIPAINSLCSQFFWPGIDLTECLQYPDFTCIVLYKKLVIGFAILVPDVNYNEAYISFFFVRPEWRRAGIGTFMLYHLIQTCMGKDVTLHVSVTNSAVILYQRFGFKIEEFVQDFYDKYMTSGQKESRHALFLRLSR